MDKLGGVVVYGREGEAITTIIAKIHEDGVDLGWDSLITPRGEHTGKVRHINGQFHLGVAGYLRHMDILHYAEVPSVHPADLEDPDFDARGYLVSQVVPTWQRALKQSHDLDPDTCDEWPKGRILIVIAGRVFTSDSVFAISEHNYNVGIGSGSDYALGALAAGKSVRKAMEIAADLDTGTGGTIYVEKGLK